MSVDWPSRLQGFHHGRRRPRVVRHDDSAQPWYSGGAEVWLRDKLALRVGAFGSFEEGAADLSYTGGVGIRMGKAEVGYALVWSDGGLSAQCFTASSSF